MDPLKKKRFLWGVLLAWIPWLPAIVGLSYAFRGIAREHATGIAAVAGGLTEMFLLVGLVTTVGFEIGAIVLLVRAFEGGHWLRSVFSTLSICLSGLMLLLLGIYLWLSRMKS